MLRKEFLLFFCLLAIFSNSCARKDSAVKDCEVSLPTKQPKDGIFVRSGLNSFVYKEYAPLSSKSVTVRHYIPNTGNIENMLVLFSCHGFDRDANIQVSGWKYLAEANGFVVIAPKFTQNRYCENDHQFGSVMLRALIAFYEEDFFMPNV